MHAEPIWYQTIRFTPNAVQETTDNSVDVSIPRAEVVSIELDYGFTSERMGLQILLALATLLGLFYALGALGPGNPKWAMRILMFAIMFSAIAIFLLWRALHRGPFLRVRTRREVRKLAFRGRLDWPALHAFLDRARTEHGWECNVVTKQGG